MTPRNTSTLHPLIATYTEHRRKVGEFTPQTAKNTRLLLGSLATAHGQRPVAQLGPATIARWREQIGHLEDSTRALYQSHVRTFCRWLVTEGHIKRDPTIGMPTVRLHRRHPVTLTPAEKAALHAHVAGDLRAAAICHLLLGLGLRCIEVSRLRLADYDRDARLVVIKGKGGHERALPVTDTVRHALDAYLDATGRRSGPLIRSEAHPNRPLAPKTISIYVRRWMSEAGIKRGAWDGRSAHACRRTVGTEVMADTGNIQVVQELLGHSSIETSARHYLRRVPMDQLREAMERRDEAA